MIVSVYYVSAIGFACYLIPLRCFEGLDYGRKLTKFERFIHVIVVSGSKIREVNYDDLVSFLLFGLCTYPRDDLRYI